MRNLRRAFTLLELLTVIAITAILLTLIILPVFQSFNLTRQAQALADAQDKGRQLTERISREIGNAVSVRSTSYRVSLLLNGLATAVPAHTLVVRVPGANGNLAEVPLPYTKLDLIVPALDGDGTAQSGYVDPVTGKVDPTLTAPKGQVRLPVAPGQSMIRYFVGLANPLAAYNNPYTDYKNPNGTLWFASNSSRDNLVVLYRAEIVPYVYRAGVGSNGDTSIAWRPNLNYFQSDAVTDTTATDLDDPKFFVPNLGQNNVIVTNDARATRINNWRKRAVVQTEVSRYDMILPQYDKRSRQIAFDGNVPRVTPLVQFRPTQVSNDPARGQVAVRSGEESANAAIIAPDVFQTQYGLWNNAVVREYSPGYDRGNPNRNGYLIAYARNDILDVAASSIYAFFPATMTDEFADGIEVFDVYTYDQSITQGIRYPFTKAALAADARSGWLSNANARSLFTPFRAVSGQGKIVTSFGIEEVGTAASMPVVAGADPNRPNQPTLYLTSPPQSPVQDNGSGAVFAGGAYDINRAFNRAWNEHPELQPNLQRFIDLRVTPNEDGTLSPLFPDPAAGEVVGLPKARVVPGSETVIGPDQNPGPNYGQPIRYTRTTRVPGPNQYRINYVDQPEGVDTYTSLGLSAPPATFTAADFSSAVIQPRFRAGYIQLNSDPNSPLPSGYTDIATSTFVQVPFKVSYRFQFTGRAAPGTVNPGQGLTDVFAVDYDSRELMQVLLTIRNYPQSNLPNPQVVTLKSTATIRNLIR